MNKENSTTTQMLAPLISVKQDEFKMVTKSPNEIWQLLATSQPQNETKLGPS